MKLTFPYPALLAAIKATLDQVVGELATLKGDLKEVKDDLAKVKDDLAEVKDDLAEVKDDLAEVQGDVKELKNQSQNPFLLVRSFVDSTTSYILNTVENDFPALFAEFTTEGRPWSLAQLATVDDLNAKLTAAAVHPAPPGASGFLCCLHVLKTASNKLSHPSLTRDHLDRDVFSELVRRWLEVAQGIPNVHPSVLTLSTESFLACTEFFLKSEFNEEALSANLPQLLLELLNTEPKKNKKKRSSSAVSPLTAPKKSKPAEEE